MWPFTEKICQFLVSIVKDGFLHVFEILEKGWRILIFFLIKWVHLPFNRLSFSFICQSYVGVRALTTGSINFATLGTCFKSSNRSFSKYWRQDSDQIPTVPHKRGSSSVNCVRFFICFVEVYPFSPGAPVTIFPSNLPIRGSSFFAVAPCGGLPVELLPSLVIEESESAMGWVIANPTPSKKPRHAPKRSWIMRLGQPAGGCNWGKKKSPLLIPNPLSFHCTWARGKHLKQEWRP